MKKALRDADTACCKDMYRVVQKKPHKI